MGCPCKESWVKTYGSSNGNCAHVLHQYMIVNGESAPFDKTKYVCCEEGRLVRANSVRNAIFAVKYSMHKTPPVGNCYIYCTFDGVGHVYYGTKDKCVAGNGLAATKADAIEYYY